MIPNDPGWPFALKHLHEINVTRGIDNHLEIFKVFFCIEGGYSPFPY